MSNFLSLSINAIDSDAGSNNEKLISYNNNNIDQASISSKKKYSFKVKFISIFLNIKQKKKRKKNQDDKIIEDEFINKNLPDNSSFSFESDSEDSEQENHNLMLNKFRTSVKKVLRQKKNRDWKEFMREYEKKIKLEKSLKFRMKNIFNVNSDFIIIWKSTFSAFNIIFVFIYFLKYILMELSKKKN